MRRRREQPIVSIVEVPVSHYTARRLRPFTKEAYGPLRLAWNLVNVRLWAGWPSRDARAAVQEHTGIRIGPLGVMKLMRDRSLDVGDTRIVLRVLPRVEEPPVTRSQVLDAKHNRMLEWPEPSQAPRILKSAWNAAWDACGPGEVDPVVVAPLMKPIQTAARDLNMLLPLEDAIKLVRTGAAFTCSTWSKVPAYVLYARDCGDDVYFTVSAAPPMGGGRGGGD